MFGGEGGLERIPMVVIFAEPGIDSNLYEVLHVYTDTFANHFCGNPMYTSNLKNTKLFLYPVFVSLMVALVALSLT